ncbi:hypothetical protein AYO47_01740 [Planctomyces sp. SCGC AG-212-M04]|nr:hypothetical protein AYO47_01740 [Planctomyces sp. SCGC AG-212-M04]
MSKFRQASSTANFDVLTFSVGSHGYLLARNHRYPVVAFAEPERGDGCPLRFVELPEMRAWLIESGECEVPDLSELERLIVDDDLSSLESYERDQLKYWSRLGPLRVGDVVFNHWD